MTGIHALKSYLAVRVESFSNRVFLNYQGEPISERGIRKLVVKYRKEAGITKKASCHTLRHTFATYKAEKGVSAFQLQQWLGHANLNTTQIYELVASFSNRLNLLKYGEKMHAYAASLPLERTSKRGSDSVG